VFAVVSPGAVLPNLVAGAIAEAGAQQAGDLMQVGCGGRGGEGGGNGVTEVGGGGMREGGCGVVG
jgi:hypothetical protein